jgi:hypothetical protein
MDWSYSRRALSRLEPYEAKVSRTVLRGEGGRKVILLPDFNQALGWQRAGTLNLHIRYGQMTLALVAQAVIHQFRQRIGAPYQSWDAVHLARAMFSGLEGDVRVHQDTILVTYYNAPNAQLLRHHYEGLPKKLEVDGVDPHVPWLYGFKLDFRFK